MAKHATMLAVLALCAVAHAGSSSRSVVASSRRSLSAGAVEALQLRGGAAEPSDTLLQATFACNRLHATVLAEAMSEIAALRKIIATGEPVAGFGVKADALLTDAAQKFAAETPAGDAEVTALYNDKAEELREVATASLEPLFVQQISLLKESALEDFKKGTLGDADPTEALTKAEATFVGAAEASVPAKTGWNVKAERASLVNIMNAIIAPAKKATQIKLQAAQQLQTAMSYLQMQQQQMQAMQAQYTGGQGGKWNVGAAYRPPDTNINLSGSYQQGRTNIQVSLVPDEGAALLGQNGFTNGVGPANLGLSFNIHL